VASPPGLCPPDHGPDAATVERRDAQVAQTYNAQTSDGNDNAPHPGRATHAAANKEWFTTAKKERSAALCQIDALKSRLRLARDHYNSVPRRLVL